MRLIDGDELCKKMYHEAFEIDSDEQRWDSGCWIRYKMFERAIESMPTVKPEQLWIPVTEQLPDRRDLVLIMYYTDKGKLFMGLIFITVSDLLVKMSLTGCHYQSRRKEKCDGRAIIPGSRTDERDHPECGKD